LRLKGGENIKPKEVEKILKRHGWIEKDQGNGSHKFFYDPLTKATTLVPHSGGKDLKTGTLAAIRRQTGIDEIR